jgi:hypothetical protein
MDTNILTRISYSISSNKGIYALLLGSGVSRSSGIYTAWDIILDLIRKLAVLNGEQCETHEIEWYKEKYQEEPDYSSILSKLAPFPAERLNFLKNYFEQSDDEKSNKIKEPTLAHRAIAQLIKKGYIKVVITTNFDRLLENALREIGVEPQVIRHEDDIKGAIPITHSPFTLIKINGDYLDSRFLNTKHELSDYPLELKEYIIRIINDFGLITCGWSGKWDSGLINAIRQNENRRFNSFFTYHEDLCETELMDLSVFRKGEIVKIIDADQFFTEIAERIEALEKYENNNPLNADIVIERLKKYIVKKESKIQLHDLVTSELGKAYDKIQSVESFNFRPTPDKINPLINFYENTLQILLPLSINATYWSMPEHEDLILKIVQRISEPRKWRNGESSYVDSAKFHYYSSLILLYSIGITAVKSSKFSLLTKIFNLKVSEYGNESLVYLIENVNSGMFEKKLMNSIINQNYKTPTSTWLCNRLKVLFSSIIPNEKEYNDTFDIFEYLLSLNYLNIIKERAWGIYTPHGQYHWSQRRLVMIDSSTYYKDFFEQAEIDKDNWPPIKQGMFNKSYTTYKETKEELDKYLTTVHTW